MIISGTRFAQMGSEIRSNEDISNLCGFASGYLKLLEKENFVKIFPELGLPKRKVGLHEQITVEKEAFTQNSNVFFFFASEQSCPVFDKLT